MATPAPKGPLVQRIIDAFERDYANAITLRTVASEVGRHPGYLGAIFRREMGLTSRAYLTRVRLQRAAELIERGLKIEAVALDVGYRSKKNFYHQFKQRFGMTPKQYRDRAG
ncbi:MAG: helix-turn-helix domain-containing protein [Acidobacteria bacterium]|nr:MAG: helix-turn-helix domain-containing protein [Acidobacteriota bacterium]